MLACSNATCVTTHDSPPWRLRHPPPPDPGKDDAETDRISGTRTTSDPSRRSVAPEVILVVGGLLLNFAWEPLQTPLNADASQPWRYLLWTRAHCTGGDVLILLAAHAVTALAARERRWARRERRAPILAFILTGLAYTAWSEWFNTRISLSWAYAELMPTVFGIGAAPLLQWLVIPTILVALLRRCS